ncbi:hypothetical protein GCM10007147_44900 [Nocardiopsis kunsanensis]|uniref:Nudix hydrolase domain-containing protein n=1 Tax=Nocardiopsis kunsanensis TaxID=141693 RepID=A0A919CLQ5_9ACTN|nr:NUDIX domain-containing protein [Nocardiopsis kunsanensis]GHD37111.1 hypothetical protein GCM10007147_44900 [Nocardiopsis kunsanensis]
MSDHTNYAPVNHPGSPVPADRRPWHVTWTAYSPVDITPPELRAAALQGETEAWITDPVASPQQVPVAEWDIRQVEAVVPYEMDAAGWPLNPTGRTGRSGRNLGKWGENQAADPIVVAGTGAERRVLLIRRDDIGVWAIPGGMVDPGETAPAALTRELAEETGVDLTDTEPEAILARTYVADWRNTDHAWVASTVALYTLPDVVPAQAADDATDAAWVPFSSVEQLADDLADDGGLYEAHLDLLAAAANRLAE